jgi:hypothetical protein
VVFEPSQIRSRFAAFDPKDAPVEYAIARDCTEETCRGKQAIIKDKQATGGFSGPDEFQELLQLERDY